MRIINLLTVFRRCLRTIVYLSTLSWGEIQNLMFFPFVILNSELNFIRNTSSLCSDELILTLMRRHINNKFGLKLWLVNLTKATQRVATKFRLAFYTSLPSSVSWNSKSINGFNYFIYKTFIIVWKKVCEACKRSLVDVLDSCLSIKAFLRFVKHCLINFFLEALLLCKIKV